MLQINELLEWNLTSNDQIEELHRKLGQLKKEAKTNRVEKKERLF